MTGATVANFTALAAARMPCSSAAAGMSRRTDCSARRRSTVVVGAEAHPTVLKSLGMLGLGPQPRRDACRWIGQGRMRADELPRLAGPTIVCLQAGNVNTGAFDPFAELVRRGREAPAPGCTSTARSGSGRRRAGARARSRDGLERADSWATDAHKWLNVPYDSGLAFVRDAACAAAAMAITAEYLPTERRARNPSDFTPELSRRARGVEVWAALHTLGRAGLAEMIERNCAQARRFAEGLAAAGFEILNDVVLNQVLV